MKYLDISMELNQNTVVWKEDAPPELMPICRIPEQSCNFTWLNFSAHAGTHIDAPAHMLEQGKRLDELPVDAFYAYASVIDVSAYHGKQIDEHVLMNSAQQIENNEYIIFYTGYEQYWGQEKYFKDFPVLTLEAAQLLCGKNLKGIGLDACSVDPVGSQDLPIHHILLNSGLTIVENLTNLKNLIGTRFLFSCFPTSWTGG